VINCGLGISNFELGIWNLELRIADWELQRKGGGYKGGQRTPLQAGVEMRKPAEGGLKGWLAYKSVEARMRFGFPRHAVGYD
jgi:hypothetical protein